MREDFSNLIKLYFVFAKIGLFTIGGGIAMIPLIIEEVSVKRSWLSEEEAFDTITVCQSLPGVIAVNIATYIGYSMQKLSGAIFATAGVITPSFIIIVVLSNILAQIGGNPLLLFVMSALQAATAALILLAAVSVGRKAVKDKFGLAVACASFFAVTVFKVPVYIVITAAAFAGILFKYERTLK